MVKVITYGTYDVLHFGHINLLKKAKALGDYLIVGVTSEDYDRSRGKINNQQSLMERINAVRGTGLADEIVVEEYEGQKIDDIRRYGVDIFTVGSDWEGRFDYLNEYCKVVYLPRTEGISSSEIRAENRKLKIGVVGENRTGRKFINECRMVNGGEIFGACTEDGGAFYRDLSLPLYTVDYDVLLKEVDAVYIVSHPRFHYDYTKKALLAGKHVICESPVAEKEEQAEELFALAKKEGLVLFDGIKTAYATAYERMLLSLKSGVIGDVVSVDATCTGLKPIPKDDDAYLSGKWNSICSWGPIALLPVFQLLGTAYSSKRILSAFADRKKTFDYFTKIEFVYPHAVASVKVGKGIKSEGDLVISGTKGYIYIPAPWWKTDYYELRFENQEDNKRIFYQLNGEGIRQEIVAFLKAIENSGAVGNVSEDISKAISRVVEDLASGRDVFEIAASDGQ